MPENQRKVNVNNHENYLAHFGRLVKKYRKEKQDNLAIELEVSEQTISKIERGNYPGLKFKLVVEICEYLKIPMNELPPPHVIFKIFNLKFPPLTYFRLIGGKKMHCN